MGYLVNPKGFRIGRTFLWDTSFYVFNKLNFSFLFYKFFNIRFFFNNLLKVLTKLGLSCGNLFFFYTYKRFYITVFLRDFRFFEPLIKNKKHLLNSFRKSNLLYIYKNYKKKLYRKKKFYDKKSYMLFFRMLKDKRANKRKKKSNINNFLFKRIKWFNSLIFLKKNLNKIKNIKLKKKLILKYKKLLKKTKQKKKDKVESDKFSDINLIKKARFKYKNLWIIPNPLYVDFKRKSIDYSIRKLDENSKYEIFFNKFISKLYFNEFIKYYISNKFNSYKNLISYINFYKNSFYLKYNKIKFLLNLERNKLYQLQIQNQDEIKQNILRYLNELNFLKKKFNVKKNYKNLLFFLKKNFKYIKVLKILKKKKRKFFFKKLRKFKKEYNLYNLYAKKNNKLTGNILKNNLFKIKEFRNYLGQLLNLKKIYKFFKYLLPKKNLFIDNYKRIIKLRRNFRKARKKKKNEYIFYQKKYIISLHYLFIYLNYFIKYNLYKLYFIRNDTKINISYYSLKAPTSSLVCFYIKRLLKLRFKPQEIIYKIWKVVNRNSYINGLRVHFFGRFSRKQRADHKVYKFGKLSLNTVTYPIDYTFDTIVLKNSICGIKIYISYRPKKSSNLSFFDLKKNVLLWNDSKQFFLNYNKYMIVFYNYINNLNKYKLFRDNNKLNTYLMNYYNILQLNKFNKSNSSKFLLDFLSILKKKKFNKKKLYFFFNLFENIINKFFIEDEYLFYKDHFNYYRKYFFSAFNYKQYQIKKKKKKYIKFKDKLFSLNNYYNFNNYYFLNNNYFNLNNIKLFFFDQYKNNFLKYLNLYFKKNLFSNVDNKLKSMEKFFNPEIRFRLRKFKKNYKILNHLKILRNNKLKVKTKEFLRYIYNNLKFLKYSNSNLKKINKYKFLKKKKLYLRQKKKFKKKLFLLESKLKNKKLQYLLFTNYYSKLKKKKLCKLYKIFKRNYNFFLKFNKKNFNLRKYFLNDLNIVLRTISIPLKKKKNKKKNLKIINKILKVKNLILKSNKQFKKKLFSKIRNKLLGIKNLFLNNKKYKKKKFLKILIKILNIKNLVLKNNKQFIKKKIYFKNYLKNIKNNLFYYKDIYKNYYKLDLVNSYFGIFFDNQNPYLEDIFLYSKNKNLKNLNFYNYLKNIDINILNLNETQFAIRLKISNIFYNFFDISYPFIRPFRRKKDFLYKDRRNKQNRINNILFNKKLSLKKIKHIFIDEFLLNYFLYRKKYMYINKYIFNLKNVLNKNINKNLFIFRKLPSTYNKYLKFLNKREYLRLNIHKKFDRKIILQKKLSKNRRKKFFKYNKNANLTFLFDLNLITRKNEEKINEEQILFNKYNIFNTNKKNNVNKKNNTNKKNEQIISYKYYNYLNPNTKENSFIKKNIKTGYVEEIKFNLKYLDKKKKNLKSFNKKNKILKKKIKNRLLFPYRFLNYFKKFKFNLSKIIIKSKIRYKKNIFFNFFLKNFYLKFNFFRLNKRFLIDKFFYIKLKKKKRKKNYYNLLKKKYKIKIINNLKKKLQNILKDSSIDIQKEKYNLLYKKQFNIFFLLQKKNINILLKKKHKNFFFNVYSKIMQKFIYNIEKFKKILFLKNLDDNKLNFLKKNFYKSLKFIKSFYKNFSKIKKKKKLNHIKFLLKKEFNILMFFLVKNIKNILLNLNLFKNIKKIKSLFLGNNQIFIKKFINILKFNLKKKKKKMKKIFLKKIRFLLKKKKLTHLNYQKLKFKFIKYKNININFLYFLLKNSLLTTNSKINSFIYFTKYLSKEKKKQIKIFTKLNQKEFLINSTNNILLKVNKNYLQFNTKILNNSLKLFNIKFNYLNLLKINQFKFFKYLEYFFIINTLKNLFNNFYLLNNFNNNKFIKFIMKKKYKKITEKLKKKNLMKKKGIKVVRIDGKKTLVRTINIKTKKKSKINLYKIKKRKKKKKIKNIMFKLPTLNTLIDSNINILKKRNVFFNNKVIIFTRYLKSKNIFKLINNLLFYKNTKINYNLLNYFTLKYKSKLNKYKLFNFFRLNNFFLKRKKKKIKKKKKYLYFNNLKTNILKYYLNVTFFNNYRSYIYKNFKNYFFIKKNNKKLKKKTLKSLFLFNHENLNVNFFGRIIHFKPPVFAKLYFTVKKTIFTFFFLFLTLYINIRFNYIYDIFNLELKDQPLVINNDFIYLKKNYV